MTEITLQIVLAVIALLGVVITSIVAPLLKSKLTKEQRNNILFWTEIAVVAIEKHYEGEIGQGKLKKEYVTRFLIDTLKIDKHMTPEQLSVIIDAVVEQVVNANTVELTF